jgi:hypothetical protein
MSHAKFLLLLLFLSLSTLKQLNVRDPQIASLIQSGFGRLLLGYFFL